jgi:hypothetical protein
MARRRCASAKGRRARSLTSRRVDLRGLERCNWWEWTPDGSTLVIWAHHKDSGSRHYALALDTSEPPVAVTPSGSGWRIAVSPDSRQIAAILADQTIATVAISGGEPRVVPGTEPGDVPLQWSEDGRALFVFKPERRAVTIDRVDLASGARSPWHELRPADAAGIIDIGPIYMTRDGQRYAYGFRRFITDLYIVEGVS